MIAVIIINYNLFEHTRACVNSVLESVFAELKIFLIDNGSNIGDYISLKEIYSENPRVSLLRINKNIGYVGGVNFGIKAASEGNPDYFLIMNNDTIIDKSAITELVNAAKRHKNEAIVSGKVYYFDHPDILQHTGVMFSDRRYLKTFYPGKNEKDVGQHDEEMERDSLDDVFWLLPARVVRDTGFYCDFYYLYAEQGDYAQRARRKGYKLIYTPKAKIWHKESMTTGEGNPRSLSICYYRGQGMFISQYRYLEKKYFFRLILRNFLKYSAKALFYKGDESKRAFATLRGYFYGFKWMFNKKPNNGYNPYLAKN